jgi:DNA invertase Pin-like site-specific DNA recombinase
MHGFPSRTTVRTLPPQVSALKSAGCKRVFEDKASGGRWDRPELHRLLDQLRAGDTLVVWKLNLNSDGLIWALFGA